MKKNLSILLVIIMLISLVGCSSTSNKTNDSNNKATDKENTAPTDVLAKEEDAEADNLPAAPVEIELWTDMTINDAILTDMIAKFEEAYTAKGHNYTVKLNKFAGSERSALISAAIETKTLPALLLSAWFTTSDYVHQGLIADITDIADTVKDDMYDSVYNAALIDGKSYMVGLYQSYYGFLYNADMLKAAGLEKFVPENEYEVAAWSLDDFENTILPALSANFAGTEKYPIGLFAADNQADTFMMNWLTCMGGKLWDNGYSVAGDDANTVEALDKIISWMNNGLTNTNVVTKSGAEVGGEFKNQMSAITSGQFTNYKANLLSMEKGEIEKFDMRIGAIPVKNNGTDIYTMADYIYGASVMNNGNEDQIAVGKEFIRWLLSDRESLTAINTNAFPCYASITEAAAGDNPVYTELAKMEPYIWDFTGNAAGYVSTRSLLFPELQAAFSGEKTAAQALADYQKNANEVIDDYMQNSVVLNQ